MLCLLKLNHVLLSPSLPFSFRLVCYPITFAPRVRPLLCYASYSFSLLSRAMSPFNLSRYLQPDLIAIYVLVLSKLHLPFFVSWQQRSGDVHRVSVRIRCCNAPTQHSIPEVSRRRKSHKNRKLSGVFPRSWLLSLKHSEEDARGSAEDNCLWRE